jgi:hypothetical protein
MLQLLLPLLLQVVLLLLTLLLLLLLLCPYLWVDADDLLHCQACEKE